MRLIISVFILVFATANANAQLLKKKKKAKEETEVETSIEKLPWEHEVGINASLLIERILNFSEREFASSPYLLLYNGGKKNWTLRAGIGGSNKKTTTSEEGFADSETQQTSSFNARLGYGIRRDFGDKWTATFALDGIYDWELDKNTSDTSFDKIIQEDRKTGFGGGPTLGIQYNFGKRLSLYAEGSFYYTVSNTRNGTFFTNFPELDDLVENVEEQELIITLPSTIYLVFKF